MTSSSDKHPRDHTDLVTAYALHALPSADRPGVEARISECPDCRDELERLRPIVQSLDSSVELVRPSASLSDRLASRIAEETGAEPVWPATVEWPEPEWEEVAPGISCQLLATDTERHRVSMLVRLGAGIAYPPHTHAGVEELHLLHGELWIEDRKLYPGDYNRAEPGTADKRVWTENGCTCVLITSSRDALA